MSAQLIDGKEVAKAIRRQLKVEIRELAERGVVPGLAAVLVGDDPASQTYVASKAKACEKLGIYSRVVRKPAELSQDDLLAIVGQLNDDPKIHGILVQSPVPPQIDELTVTLAIKPEKDVDGFHPHNVGLLSIGRPQMISCTPYGIVKLLEYYQIETSGKEVVVVGRSNIVGKPIALLLMQKTPTANATVTVAHSRSEGLASICRRADIVIAAIGRAHTITADMIKPGAVVIDVGINRIEDPSSDRGYRLVGDVDFDGCRKTASFITPVPGGVGPMTIAMLLTNTVRAARLQTGS